MTNTREYTAPSITELGTVHELTLASVLKNKKLAFNIDFLSKKHNIPILFTKCVH